MTSVGVALGVSELNIINIDHWSIKIWQRRNFINWTTTEFLRVEPNFPNIIHSNGIEPKFNRILLWAFVRFNRRTNRLDYDTIQEWEDESMNWVMPLLLAAMLSPLAKAAQHDEWALVAHGERKEAAYLVLRRSPKRSNWFQLNHWISVRKLEVESWRVEC